jgi:hypothetical protein
MLDKNAATKVIAGHGVPKTNDAKQDPPPWPANQGRDSLFAGSSRGRGMAGEISIDGEHERSRAWKLCRPRVNRGLTERGLPADDR